MIRPSAASVLAASVLTALAPLAAQDQKQEPKLEARSFTPAGYRAELFVDFKALNEHGNWDAVRRSPTGTMFGIAEQHLGFELAELERIHAYPEIPDGQEEPENQRRGGMAVFVGSDKIVLPRPEGYREDKLGGFAASVEDREWTGADPDLWLQVRPGLIVYATQHLVRPVVEGKAAPGVPDAEFLLLTSGKGGLAHVVVTLTDAMLEDLPFPLPEGVLHEDDKPRFFALRLRLLPQAAKDGEEQEPEVVLDAILRHQTGAKGPEAVRALAQKGLDEAKEHPRLGALKRFWSKIELKTDGRDVTLRLPLGRPRDAGGNLAMLIAPLTFFGMTAEAAPAAVEVAAPAPKPATEPGRGRGGER
jgi:hypothetical protein